MNPIPFSPIARRAGLLAVAPALWIGATPDPAGAQYSPNCERNGRRDYCAYTQVAGATNERQEFAQIVFADHTVYEVLRNETSCQQQGNPRAIPAWSRGTAYEGGYKHEDVGQGIHITDAFLD